MISNKIIALAIVMATMCYVAAALEGMPKIGGVGDEKPADDAVREVLQKVHSQVEKKVGKSYESLKPIGYRTQVVAGMNYFIKAEATEKNGAKSLLHVRVYRPFRGEHELSAVRTDVGRQDPLEYFQ